MYMHNIDFNILLSTVVISLFKVHRNYFGLNQYTIVATKVAF